MSRTLTRYKLSGISLAALAASIVAMPQNAQAQSFIGTPTTQFGGVNITTAPNTTNIVVTSPRAVINWDIATPVTAPPTTTPVIFQPQNTTANFISGFSGNFIVLNRILPTDPTRAVQFNGIVNAPGNGVFFYSPGGIVLGSTAVFNVGRLLLTTNSVAVDGNGGFFQNNDISVASLTSGSTAAVNINPGAQINALSEGSFVVAIAPRVIDSGTTVVNGTKALVAGEFVNMTYNAGLFDISVTQGTAANGEVIRHDGSTTGPASSGAGDFHRIYMAAIPSNTAVSMFVSGANGLGFDVAGAADVVGNAIILSGGSNIREAGFASDVPMAFASTPSTNIAADINITGGNYTSSVNALSNNNAAITVNQPAASNFASDVMVQARNNASLNISNSSVRVAGDLLISADALPPASPIPTGSSQTAGNASIIIADAGSSLTTNGGATVSAQGTGSAAFSVGNGGDGRGGTARVINAGTWNTNGLRVRASGFGGQGNTGGGGYGGTVEVSSSGALNVQGTFNSEADGIGGDGLQSGGIGQGGTTTVQAIGTSGVISAGAADQLIVSASGEGGSNSNPTFGNGGNGTGGTASLNALGGGGIVSATLSNRVDANGIGGNGASSLGPITSGGTGTGGTANIRVENSSAIGFSAIGTSLTLTANGAGGSGNTGGAATGGNANITNLAGGAVLVLASDVSGSASVSASAIGGDGLNGNGGAATGGSLSATFDGTTILNNAAFNADAIAGIGSTSSSILGNGGNALGGTARVSSAGTTTYRAGLSISADGVGGVGVNGGTGAAGNQAALIVSGGALTAAAITVSAAGSGGAASGATIGGNGIGSNSIIEVTNGSLTSSGATILNSTGTGGSGFTGGNGTGGTARMSIANGQAILRENVSIDGRGIGGQGVSLGGNAIGGGAVLNVDGVNGSFDLINDDGFLLTAAALGGAGFASISGAGGDATAGTANFAATNGATISINVGDYSIDASAQGGSGLAGVGGDAVAGTATIDAQSNAAVTLRGAPVNLTASAIGGNGTRGGIAVGGTTAANVDVGSSLTNESLLVISAYGDGGRSFGGNNAGGDGTGGSVLLNTQGTTNIGGNVLLDGHGTGGASIANGNGGAGTGGFTRLLSAGTTNLAGTLNANSNGTGGAGVNGGAGTGGDTQTQVSGGTFTLTGAAVIDSSGFGGAGAGTVASFGNGGVATGGNSLVLVTGGVGTFSSTLNMNGGATGGDGRNGGNAFGGASNVLLSGGSLNIIGGSGVNTNGAGGNASAGLGGTGGDGTGGTIGFLVNSPATNFTLSSAFVTSSARGDGGDGGSASAALLALGLPAIGGNGGNGTGGTIVIGSPNSAGNLNFGSVGAQTIAEGGVGGVGGTFGPGGNGGSATGGAIQIGYGSSAATATGVFNAQSVVAIASAQAGDAGTGTVFGNGGNGAAGNIYLGNGSGGIISVTNFVSIVAQGISGFGSVVGTADGGNAIIIASSNPNGGGSSFTAGSASVSANGLIGSPPFTPDLPTGRHGRVAIFANGGNVQLGTTIMSQLGSAGETAVPAAFGIINSGLSARNAQLLITNSFNGQFAGDVALATDGGNISFIGAGTNGFNFLTPGNIVDTLTGTAPTGTGLVTSNTFININSGGNILTPNSTYQSQLTTNIVATGNLNIGGANAGDFLFLQSGGNMTAGNILGGDVFEADSGGIMTLGNIRADSDVDLIAAGAVTTGTISSGDTVTIGSGATISTGNIDAGINNPSADPAAAYAVGLRGVGTVGTGTITAANRIGIGSATGSIFTSGINTGEFFLALAATDVTVNGGITTGTGANGITYIADASMLGLINPVTLDPAPVFNAAPVRLSGNIAISSTVTTGRFVAASTGTFFAEGSISAANANTASGAALFISSGSDVTTQNLSAALGDVVIASSGAVATDDILSGGNVDISLETLAGVAPISIRTANINAAGDITLSAIGPITAGNANAGGFIEVDPNAGNATLGNLRAGQFVQVESGGNILTGNISAGDYIELSDEIGVANSITTGTLDAGIVNPSADPAATFNIGVRAVNDINIGAVNSRGSTAFVSDQGSIGIGNITTQGFLLALARTGATLGNITTGTGANGVTFIGSSSALTDPNFDTVNLDTNPAIAAILAGAPARIAGPLAITGPVTTGRFAAAADAFSTTETITAANADTASGPALLISSGGDVTAQNLTATLGSVGINGGAAITAANINGTAGVNVLGIGAVTSGNVASGGAINIGTQGAITTGSIQGNGAISLSSNASVTTGAVNGNNSFSVNATDNIVTGAIDADNQVSLLSRAGSITTAAVNSGQYFLALAGNGVTVNGGITTGTGANGVTYIANSSMQDLIDPVTQDPSQLFGASPSQTGGPIAISGSVTTGRFIAATNSAFTAQQAIGANTSALINSGGLATFNGIVNAPNITVTSNGLDIGANGGLGSATTASLNINAGTGSGPIRLGGDAGTGYVIDSNEMTRLRAQNIRFRAGGTAAPLLTIGSFTLLGSAGASSNLVGGSGAFSIETNGAVRVIGNAAIDGAAAGNALSVTAGGRIDIVNDLGGSIRLSNAAGEPAGILNLTAGTVTSASDSLITQLTQNANFVGRDAALDASAATPLEQGYLGAGTMNVSVSNGLFIQNSNTAQLRGGYSVGSGGLNVTANNASGSPVNLVVNGRALQANGTFLTNKDALDAATFTSLSQFAPGATLNGCLITGAPCVIFSDGVLQFVSILQANAIDNADEDEGLVASGEAQPIVYVDSLVPDPAAADQPKIIEPVTGSGNSEAWSQTPNATGEQP